VDFDVIGTALAARYAPAQVTPPTGYDNIRGSAVDLPNQMLPLPAVLVFLDAGTFRTGNGTRLGGHDWFVRFYYNQTGDLERDMTALRKWNTVLADQLKASVQLGGSQYVARVTVESYQVGTMQYAKEDYSGIEYRVHVTTTEPWAATA
jgi:hypothetical protein